MSTSVATVKITNKLPAFSASVRVVMDDAVREGARDTLINAKTKAPLQKGTLRSESNVKKMATALYRVSFFAVYARYQEFGGDANRTIRNYTTPGTGKHYLRDAGNQEQKKLIPIFKKHARRARV